MKRIIFRIICTIILVLLVINNYGATFTSITTGNWSDGGTWDQGAATPGASDDVVIASGHTVTVNAIGQQCSSVTFAANGADSYLTIAASKDLTVTNGVSFSDPSADGFKQYLTVSGTLTCASVTFANTSGSTRNNILYIGSSGALNVSGNITTNGASTENKIQFLSGGTINIGGNLGTSCSFIASTGTINFNGAGTQTTGGNYTFYNLTSSGTSTLQLGGNTIVNNTLTISNSITLGSYYLTMNSTATFAGAFSGSNMIKINGSGQLVKNGTANAHFARTYPVGTGSNYAPVNISSISATYAGTGSIYIGTTGTKHPSAIGTENVARYWKITTYNITLTNISGYFEYADADISGTEGNYNTVGRFSSPTWNTGEGGVAINTGANRIELTNATNYVGDWTTGEAAAFPGGSNYYTKANGNWTTASIWEGGVAPNGAGHNVYISHTVTQNQAGLNVDNLVVNSAGSLALYSNDITVNGTTTVAGSLVDNTASGADIFIGLVTVSSGGSTSITSNSTCEFRGGITNNGTFSKTGTGAITFSTNEQTITNSSSTMTLAGAVAINSTTNFAGANSITLGSGSNITIAAGIVVSNANTGGVTVSGVIDGSDGTSEWNNSTGYLKYYHTTAPMSTGVFTASGAGNTIEYYRAGDQSIFIPAASTYHNLILSGSGNKSVIGNLTLNGTLTVTSATMLFGGTARTVTVTGNLSGTGTINTSSNTHTLNLGGATNSITTFTTDANASTINYNRAGSQTIFASTNYRNLTVSGSGTKTIGGIVTVNNTFTIAAGCTFAFDAASARTVIISGNLSAATGTIDMSGGSQTHTLKLGGATNDLGTLTTAAVASVVEYSRGGAQTVFTSSNYRNFTLSGSGNKSLQGNISIGGDMTVTTASLIFGATARTVTVTGNVSGTGTIDMQSNTHTLNLGGATNTITTFTIDANVSTVNYNRSGNQSMFTNVSSYRNLTISGSGEKSFSTYTTVNNDLSITGGTLKFPSGAAYSLDINGDLSAAAGTIDMSPGSQTHSLLCGGTNNTLGTLTTAAVASTVTFDRAGAQDVFASANHRNVSIAGSGTKTLQGNLTIAGTLSISSTLAFGATARTITLSDDLSGAGTLDMQSNAAHLLNLGGTNNAITTFTTDANATTVNYNKSGNQNMFGSVNYRNLTISGSGTKTLGGTTTVNDNLDVSAGTLEVAAQTLSVTGTTSVTGTLNDNNSTGNSTFTGTVTISGTLSSASATTLTFKGDVTNNGTFNHSTGTVVFDGTTALSGSNNITVNNMTVNNTKTVTIPEGFGLTVDGTLTLSGAQCLVIESNSVAADGIGSLITNGSIAGAGTAKVERYFTGNATMADAKSWYLSSPISDKPKNDLTGVHAIYEWTAATQTWNNVSASGSNMEAMRGFVARFDASGDQNFIGSLNTGTQTITIEDDWNLIGNPYPSAIDWNAASGWTKTNIENNVWVRSAISTVASWNGTSEEGTNGATRYIQAGQGFYVHTEQASPALQMTNAVRVHNGVQMLKKGLIKNKILLKAKYNGREDDLIIGSMDIAEENFDACDTRKFLSTDKNIAQIYTINNEGKKLAIDFSKSIQSGKTYKIGLQAPVGVTCTLTIDLKNYLTNEISVLLEDKSLNTIHNFSEKSSYTFLNGKAIDNERFVIHFVNLDSSSLSFNKTNVSCNGGSDGKVEINVIGGKKALTYQWSNSATTKNISGLIAGTYSVTVNYSDYTTEVSGVEISEPDTIKISSIVTNVSCSAYNSGKIGINVEGGTAGYNYAWSNGADSYKLDNLVAGTYIVTVTDANLCTNYASVEVENTATLNVNSEATNVLCNGTSTGSVSLTITDGGEDAYSYIWNNGATSQDIDNLVAGTYTVTVSNGDLCKNSVSVEITEPDSLIIAVDVTNISCNNNNGGSINVSVEGGTPAYGFSWSNSAISQNLEGLVADIYTVTVTDANLCTNYASVEIEETEALNVNSEVTNVLCNGTSTGSVSLTITDGGEGAYSYIWNNGETSQNLENLAAGTYTVTVTDTNLCKNITSVEITESTALNVSSKVTNVLCYGDNNGKIDVSVEGGTGDYSYIWNSGDTTQDLENLAQGSYSVTVVDANLCKNITNVEITEPEALSISSIVTNVSMIGGSDGAIDITVSGGLGAYVFLWSNSAKTEDLKGIAANTYTVTATDINACTISVKFIVTESIPSTDFLNGKNDLKAYYNNGSLYIEGNETILKNSILTVYNVLGQVIVNKRIYKTGVQDIVLPANKYYLVNIKSDKTTKTVKIFVR